MQLVHHGERRTAGEREELHQVLYLWRIDARIRRGVHEFLEVQASPIFVVGELLRSIIYAVGRSIQKTSHLLRQFLRDLLEDIWVSKRISPYTGSREGASLH